MRPRLFDCIIYNDEHDILELRVHTVRADFTFIVIGSSTFQGEKFTSRQIESKINTINHIMAGAGKDIERDYLVHVCPVDMLPGHWERENEQREATRLALAMPGDPDDLFIFSDVDEIPRLEWPCTLPVTPATLFMPIHYFGMNYRTTSEHPYPVLVTRGEMEKHGYSVKWLRDKRSIFPKIPNGGWHFTWLGGPSGIRRKVESFSHKELNTPEKTTDLHLTACIAGKMLPDGTGTGVVKVEIDDTFPPYLLANIDKYQKYMLP